MTALEVKLIAYALLALILFGGSAWVGAHFTAKHYQAVIAANTAAQTQALLQAQQRVIDAQNAQKAAETAAENAHALMVQADTASRTATLGSVRNLEAALHSRLLPAAVVDPRAVQGAQPGPLDAQKLAGLVERFNASLDGFIQACQHIDDDRTSILSLEPKVTP